MESKKDFFSKLGRIFVALFAVTVFAGAVTGCGKDKTEEANQHIDKYNAAVDGANATMRQLLSEGLWGHTSDAKVREVCDEASKEDLERWNGLLATYIHHANIAKAEGQQKNVGADIDAIDRKLRYAGSLKTYVVEELATR